MAADEKLPLVERTPSTERPTSRGQVWRSMLTVSLVFLCFRGFLLHSRYPSWDDGDAIPRPSIVGGKCPQVEPLLPELVTPELAAMDVELRSRKFLLESVQRLSGAVQIPTESFDDMGPVGDDQRWDVFSNMSSYMEKTFPHVSETLERRRVNTHGLLYIWHGSIKVLKPTVLMAHQDVVPVPDATKSEWKHPAFGGSFDGKYVWGRGSSDCKNSLIGIMEAVELLIKAGFKPQRTLILSFGFDEEISGFRGAKYLAEAIVDDFGSKSAAIIVDEGGSFTTWYGLTIAIPGVTEKGYVSVEIIVRTPGGHSSIPPPHTGIGVAAELITLIENNPYMPKLHSENPVWGIMECAETFSPVFPPALKKLLDAHDGDRLALELAKLNDPLKYLFTTSQAVDLIEGGIKVNALPERTRLVINHRVNVGEDLSSVKERITDLAQIIAKQYGLNLNAFSSTNATESPNTITLNVVDHELAPAPVTPTEVGSVTPYFVVSGTTRGLYGQEVLVAPGLMTGNTDTQHYWEVSDHIFRYAPGWDTSEQGGLGNIHTVNEKVSIVAHIKTVQWYSLFIRNMDEARMP